MVPGEEFPVVLPRTSPALYLLQHLRDESHRFAITHHRRKRSAGMTAPSLTGSPVWDQPVRLPSYGSSAPSNASGKLMWTTSPVSRALGRLWRVVFWLTSTVQLMNSSVISQRAGLSGHRLERKLV